ncbi:hypothetical protein CLIM01_07788 [Colletotrichum limetticola]|uniref:Uncharacterized protein n=1 Tax=Colletotrichum limetticola TaxID=1209924 RepID=A0ABQ9PTL5_9PEZI|nr:hypothetical protein CLIM01_07788 [Colletotrichum limetticola]
MQNETYNTRYSLVVTDPTTNPALVGLSMGERTGSRVFQWVWSYVVVWRCRVANIVTAISRDAGVAALPSIPHNGFREPSQ